MRVRHNSRRGESNVVGTSAADGQQQNVADMRLRLIYMGANRRAEKYNTIFRHICIIVESTHQRNGSVAGADKYRNLYGRRYVDLPLLTDGCPFDLADALWHLLELSQKLSHVSSERSHDICYNSLV